MYEGVFGGMDSKNGKCALHMPALIEIDEVHFTFYQETRTIIIENERREN